MNSIRLTPWEALDFSRRTIAVANQFRRILYGLECRHIGVPLQRNEFEQFRMQNALPERDVFLRMSPEGAARICLRLFSNYRGAFIPGDAVSNISDKGYGRDLDVERVLMEGVAYLERYGFVVEELRSYSGSGRGRQLSRSGREASQSPAKLETILLASKDMRVLLHPDIVARALPDFDRGEDSFETAIFNAFKRVEVAVRTVGKLQDDLIGVQLMNRAFGKDGPLRDVNADPGEQDGLRNLFAGAIAVYKNPSSHRDTGQRAADRTIYALILASELLTIVETRSK
jgi:uncharacterized protein (TIGR02391 family)